MSPSTWCAVCVQLNRATNVLPRPEIRTCAKEDHEKIPKIARVWEEAERVGDDESREDVSCCTDLRRGRTSWALAGTCVMGDDEARGDASSRPGLRKGRTPWEVPRYEEDVTCCPGLSRCRTTWESRQARGGASCWHVRGRCGWG